MKVPIRPHMDLDLKLLLAAFALLAAAWLVGCDMFATEAPGERGRASIRIALAGNAQPLAKKSDTVLVPDTLRLQLSSPGLPTVTRAVAVSAQGVTVPIQDFALYGMRNWKLKAWTVDAEDSVLHADSTIFYVDPGDTTEVTLSLVPRYSVLVARFVSKVSGGVSNIEKLQLVVNGKVVDDTLFPSKRKVFDVVLSHLYLEAGKTATVEMRALDRASPARVVYDQTTLILPLLGIETQLTVRLQ